MARADVVLGRFPAHLEAARAGKLLRSVVQSVCVELDDQAASLAAIRRSHRLRDVDERVDLLRIAAYHDIGRTALSLLELRLERTAELLRALADAPADQRLAAAERLLSLWGLQTQSGAPLLALLADPPEHPEDEIDLEGAAGQQALLRLANAAAATLRESSRIALSRRRVAGVIAVHAKGNGTVRAVLEGAANALDLDIGPIHSSADRYVHAAYATDRLRIDAPSRGPVTPSTPKLRVAREVLGLEENPRERIETDLVARTHAERFDQLRRGFERTTLSIEITGEGVRQGEQELSRTIGPMLVNRDERRGVGFYGVVPIGKTLVFEDTGRVLLDGEDVTTRAYAFSGACFASDVPHPRDAVFADDTTPPPGSPPVAKFAVATPTGALDPDFVVPHAGHSLPMPGIGIGRTRLAFFVQEGHFSVGPTTIHPSGRRVPPRPAVAFRDLSVFAPGPDEERKPAARVRLAWIERRAYAARLLVPERFRAFEDDPEGNGVLRRLLESTARFRPAGISLDAKFVSDHWVLGEKELGNPGADDPVAVLMTGARL